MDLFSRFMHLPLSEAVVRRIIEAYIPMKVQCNQEAVWSMSALRGRSNDFWTRAAGCPTIRVHVQDGWPDRANTCFLCQQGTKVPYEPPSASYTMEAIVWNLVPLFGKPTWVQSPDTAKGAVGPESDVGTPSKFAKSVDATQFAQAPAATCSLDEVTMADVVPMALRMSMREEVLGTMMQGGCRTSP